MKLLIPKILTLQEKKMIGMRLEMSLVDNKTSDLFRKFMPRRKEITAMVSDGTYALQQYDFMSFTPQFVFEKWACVEVSDFNSIPIDMETVVLESGLYAVFIHKGTTIDFMKTMQQIVQVWLPNSTYEVDNSRPHFEILGKKYLGPMNPNSEEEVWIPIK